MTRKSKTIYNILSVILLAFVFYGASRLDPFYGNFSSMAVSPKGYFFILGFGTLGALLIGYSAYKVHNRLFGILTFVSAMLACITPHSANPSSILANVHVIFAYTAFFAVSTVTLINIFYFEKDHMKIGETLKTVYLISLALAIILYLRFMCVNTVSEVIVITSLVVIYAVMVNIKK